MSNIKPPTFIYKDFDSSLTSNYNKIWNWYLNNVKEGEFEKIINNPEYRMGLNEFIDNIVDTDITLLMIIPNIINSTVLLQDLLTKFFLESSNDSNEVVITNLGPLAQSQSSIIMAQNRVNNSDLNSNQFSFGPISNQNQTIELNSIISGESGYTPSLTSEKPRNETNDDDDLYEDESSIDSYRPNISQPPSPKYSLTRVSTIQNEESLTHVPNTPRSSVSSLSEPRSPIIQIETKESEEEEDDDDIQSSSIMGEMEEHDGLQSIYSNNSSISVEYVPSMITTRTKKLNIRYKLILKNILFRDDLRNKRTAIRQIDDEGISDDWLLYDEHFRMDNLELFELNDIIEMMHNEKRILFYDLVLEKISNDEFEDDDDEDGKFPDAKDLNVVEFNGKSDNNDETEGHSIRFIQSNTTTMTPQDTIQLSKTNTIKTNYGSIKSDVDLYKPDTLFSRVERSKSTPINITKRKFKLKHHNSINNDKCIIV